MLILLVGPKGSGKSHIGRVLERRLGVHFFHVEALWLADHAECRAEGREPDVPEGVRQTHPLIGEALRRHRHVCVETTGASPEILSGLLQLGPPGDTLIARISAPLDLCRERIERRDPADHIPLAIDRVAEVHALSKALQLEADVTVENLDLSDEQVVRFFKDRLA